MYYIIQTSVNAFFIDRRRSSTTSTGSGIRVGGGLVEPKAPNHNSFMMPFGAAAVKPANLLNLLKKPKARSKSQQSRSTSKETSKSKSNLKLSEIVIVQKGYEGIKSGLKEVDALTAALKKESSTTSKKETKQSVATKTTSMEFKEVDTRSQTKEEHNLSFTVNKPIERRARHASLSKKQSSLPDQSVTISLPGSRRVSRNASVDRVNDIPENGLKKSHRSSSQEIFTGEYKMQIPSGKPKMTSSSSRTQLKMTANVQEISSDTVVMKAKCDDLEEVHTEAKVAMPKIPVPPPPPPAPPATKDAPELQLLQVTVTPQNRPNKSGFTLCSKNQMIENHPLAAQNQYSFGSSVSSKSAEKSSITSSSCTNNWAASSSTKMETSSIQQQSKTETIATVKTEQKSMNTQSMMASSSMTTTSSSNTSNGMHIEGQKFNISKSLKKASHHGSKENLSITNTRRSKHASGTNESSSKRALAKPSLAQEAGSQIGGHLKGLDVALEALAKQQKEQEMKELKMTQNSQKSMLITQQKTAKDGTTSVTVSLPPSRRGSRRGSISEGGGQMRSRKNSMDIYSANYNVRLSRQGSPTRLQQKVGLFYPKMMTNMISEYII